MTLPWGESWHSHYIYSLKFYLATIFHIYYEMIKKEAMEEYWKPYWSQGSQEPLISAPLPHWSVCLEGFQVGQTWTDFSEAMLIVSNHLVFHVPEVFFPDLSRDQGEVVFPLIPWILFIVIFEDRRDICLPPLIIHFDVMKSVIRVTSPSSLPCECLLTGPMVLCSYISLKYSLTWYSSNSDKC